jgi:micrococcal nuclease
MHTLTKLITVLTLLITTTAFAWTGKVVGVSDGDTIKVLRDGELVKVKLYGVDTPEKAQPFGNRAKKFTVALVAGKVVDVMDITYDKYGRTVGLVRVDGKLLDTALVQAGMAWVYRKYCDRQQLCNDLLSYESRAKNNGIGLWADTDPIPPWTWRKAERIKPRRPGSSGFGVPLYLADLKSMIFHRSGNEYHSECKSCTVEFKIRIAAIDAGYKPCPVCNP